MTAGWAAVLAAAVGGMAGTGARWLLARVRRGMSVRAGVLELASAVMAALGTVLAYDQPHWPLVLWIGWLAVTLSAMDLVHHRLPDAVTLPAIGVSLVAVGLTRWLAPESGSLARALLGALVVTAVFLGLAIAVPRAMGLGDVKLVLCLGITLGYVSWGTLVVGICAAFVLGALISVAGIVARRLTTGSAIPFGPFLLVGAWLALAIPGLTELVLYGG